MSKRASLVCQHLENISREALIKAWGQASVIRYWLFGIIHKKVGHFKCTHSARSLNWGHFPFF